MAVEAVVGDWFNDQTAARLTSVRPPRPITANTPDRLIRVDASVARSAAGRASGTGAAGRVGAVIDGRVVAVESGSPAAEAMIRANSSGEANRSTGSLAIARVNAAPTAVDRPSASSSSDDSWGGGSCRWRSTTRMGVSPT